MIDGTDPKQAETWLKNERPPSLDDLFEEEEEALVEPLATDTELTEHLVRLAELRKCKEALEAELKEVNKVKAEIEAVVVATFQARGVSGMKMPGVGNFSLRTDTWPSVVNMEGLKPWLAEQGEDHLIKETIHAQTFRSWWTERLAEGLDVPPEELAKAYTKNSVSFRKAK